MILTTIPPSIYVEVDTSIDLASNGATAAEWLDRAWGDIIGDAAATALQDSTNPASSLTQQGHVEEVTGRNQREPHRPEAVRRALHGIADGTIRRARFLLEGVGPDGTVGPDGWVGAMNFERAGLEHPGAASSLSCTVRRGVYPEKLPRGVQDRWSELLSGGQALHADLGWLTVDCRDAAYEAFVGGWSVNGLRQSRQQMRTYAWANLLSAGHLERLGGLQRVVDEAPVAKVIDLSVPGWELVCLQASGDLDQLSLDELRRLRDFVAPLLPERAPRFSYIGPRLNLVEMSE